MSGGLSKMIVSPIPRADCDADVSPLAMVGCDADGTSEPLARSAAADEGRNGPAALKERPRASSCALCALCGRPGPGLPAAADKLAVVHVIGCCPYMPTGGGSAPGF